MATFKARIMHAERGTEEIYDFDGPDDLMKKTPVKVIRHFMEVVDKAMFPRQHVEYELNACYKNKKFGVVTAIGHLHFEVDDADMPFMVMISK